MLCSLGAKARGSALLQTRTWWLSVDEKIAVQLAQGIMAAASLQLAPLTSNRTESKHQMPEWMILLWWARDQLKEESNKGTAGGNQGGLGVSGHGPLLIR